MDMFSSLKSMLSDADDTTKRHLRCPAADKPHIGELKERLGSFAPYDYNTAQVYRYRKMYGVNVGSMFCLEPWISTEIYKPYTEGKENPPESEGDLIECMGSEAKQKMEAHWESWIQRGDFERMASIGINTVRLPIGWWVLGPGFTQGLYEKHAEVYRNALFYLGRVLRWAEEFQIGVLLDIHAIPGGQNNDSHSGITGKPLFYQNSACQELTLQCYSALTMLVSDITHVVGLQIINEPLDDPMLEGFYYRAIQTIRAISRSLPIYIGDAWSTEKYAKFTGNMLVQFGMIVLDTHRYWVFMPREQQERVPELARKLWEDVKPELERYNADARGNLIIGEYSAVLANPSFEGEDPAKCMGDFVRHQMAAFEQVSAGTFYWTWRLQYDSWFWSFQYSLDQGVVPPEYFPFAWRKDNDQRSDVARMAEENRVEWRDRRLNGHSEYWSSQGGEYRFDLFAAGFDMGLSAAIFFYTKLDMPSKIGFVQQLASEHARHHVATHGGEQWQWEYEHGFSEAQQEFEAFTTAKNKK
ncbi:Glucan 1,3-beta-glucosidase 3 [Linderina macrospora]|uniref:Glucan 1,3-beta-glucosidase 3 n=1 Tax=Linderina macrospora TaxID=4868 RepID=A0ACC1JFV8_9FUNG|nr:Glucan 1,3-beta-glucosidase 3 [Linderina macrospora]